MKQRFLGLFLNQGLMAILFSDFQWFTVTKDRGESLCKCTIDLFRKHRASFSEILTSLAVADDHVRDANRFQHGSGHFTSVCTGFMLTAILRTYQQLCPSNPRLCQSQVRV